MTRCPARWQTEHVIPIVTPAEMGEIDAEAPEPTDVLIGRAGAAVAREALGIMGGAYGRRVVVLAGKGNNGNDGRCAAGLLERRGVRTRVIPVEEVASHADGLPEADLVIDAAFGTGFSGTWEPPRPGSAPVLAVDIPSGIDGLTGEACGSPWHAVRTVTFAALKPGLVQGDGPGFAGEVVVADIGLDVTRATSHLVEDHDVVAWIPPRASGDHKWRHAVWVVAGSPGMEGAGWLCARAAMRAGAGYVRVGSPGVPEPTTPREAVGVELPAHGWGSLVAEGASRFGAVVVGPGIGVREGVRAELEALAAAGVPVLLDADALTALGSSPLPAAASTVLTPHDGEYASLMGRAPGRDRIAAVRDAARTHGSVVLLKGPTTAIGHPDGRVLVVRSGDERLATAGTGDVLSGLVGAHLASGAEPLLAAAAGAQLHGLAGCMSGEFGVLAQDVTDHLGVARASLPRVP